VQGQATTAPASTAATAAPCALVVAQHLQRTCCWALKTGFPAGKNFQTVARHGIIFLSQFWDILYMICSFFLILHCAF
jgi:hypothetical protein